MTKVIRDHLTQTEAAKLWLFLLCLFLSIVILVVDISIPRGVANGGLYVVVVLLALRLPGQRYLLFFAILSTIFTIVGFYFSAPGGEMWKVTVNRSFAVFAIWTTAILLIHRKRAEKMILQYATALEQQAAALQASNAELERFAYVASHDLQEPLRMITSYLQLLARRYKGQLDSDADEFIDFAVDGAKRMQTLIQDLLAFSRISKQGVALEAVDCEIVLNQVLTNLQVIIEEQRAMITSDPLPTVRADTSQLVQLFQNLISNAIKFRTEELPRIHMAAKQSKDEWIFSICDNGIGIALEDADRIFLIFQRLHSREQFPGTGLGLAICQKIVARHGGRIWVESQLGQGSTFHFTMPMVTS